MARKVIKFTPRLLFFQFKVFAFLTFAIMTVRSLWQMFLRCCRGMLSLSKSFAMADVRQLLQIVTIAKNYQNLLKNLVKIL